jgi:excinuclease ABC subunit A
MEELEVRVEGARVHNLKNIHVTFPHGHLVVVTGVSGSGKSSLAFDTLYAEGQRRYVESLSAYARQFLGKLEKPEVDDIKGLAPAIAIEQKVSTRNPRSTVATATEIHDYLKLLFARVGRTYAPSGAEVKRHSVADVLAFLASTTEGDYALVTAPLDMRDRQASAFWELLSSQGYARVWTPSQGVVRLDEQPSAEGAELVVDRVPTGDRDEDWDARTADSVQTALYEGQGTCRIRIGDEVHEFSNRFEAEGVRFEEPTPGLFSFNTPQGACPTCEGFGSVLGIDPELVVPNPGLSVFEDAVAPWRGEKLGEWKEQLLRGAERAGFPVHRPVQQLSPEHLAMLWKGCAHFAGIDAFFKMVEESSYKIQYRVLQARYRGKTTCPDCGGSRLRREALAVRVGDRNLAEVLDLSVRDAKRWFDALELNAHETKVGERLLQELRHRLDILERVGLHYLTLNRPANTLSGGESQRIHLATSLSAALVGSMYILDEPSVGLHPRDADQLLGVLQALRDAGNTVIVVEHDDVFMRAADTVIDIGPGAGRLGGVVVYAGPGSGLYLAPTLTGDYLSGRKKVGRTSLGTEARHWIELRGARAQNLKDVTVKVPLERLTAVCGVSGSGKTTLVRNILVPALQKLLGEYGGRAGAFDELTGDWRRISAVEVVDQNPMGKSSRSNPVTYLKAYDDIRNLYAGQKAAQLRGYAAKHFSFNTDGGRCSVCQGDGYVTVEMQFMADVHLKCEQCHGKRFMADVLEVEFQGKSISDILELTVDEAMEFFASHQQKKITDKLRPLADVGLGYIQLGQSSSTLSGGEAQRVKLASFLVRGHSADPVLFVFDEPTTGLHMDDVQKLLTSLDALISLGHTVLVVEHHRDVLAAADWLIELGPDGGPDGGHLLYAGDPSKMAGLDSPTAAALR